MIEVVVIGRIGIDLTPPEPGIPLAEATTFVRGVGGFAGNVGFGIARLGVRTAVVSAVGDDSHAAFIRRALEEEGVDVRGLVTKRDTRTQVAFYEVRSPDDIPVTFHRSVPAPEMLLEVADAPSFVDDAPIVILSGALLAGEPARSTAREIARRRRRVRRDRVDSRSVDGPKTILDLDWRPTLWADTGEASAVVAEVVAEADVVVGSDLEFEAVGLDPRRLVEGGRPWLIGLKHGPRGASVLTAEGAVSVPAVEVAAVAGVGSGDAFVASFAAGLLRGLPPEEALARGNAAGAIVASRLLCSAAMPTNDEIESILSLRADATEVPT